jgi:hypothetical protein
MAVDAVSKIHPELLAIFFGTVILSEGLRFLARGESRSFA